MHTIEYDHIQLALRTGQIIRKQFQQIVLKDLFHRFHSSGHFYVTQP